MILRTPLHSFCTTTSMRACVKVIDKQTSFSRRKYVRIHNRRKFSNFLSNALTRDLFLIGIFEVTNFITSIGISTLLHEFPNFCRNFRISKGISEFRGNLHCTRISVVIYPSVQTMLFVILNVKHTDKVIVFNLTMLKVGTKF